MAKEYKIFISHSWTYHDDLVKLQTLLYSRGYFNVEFQEASRDIPINSENGYYVKQALKKKILNSNIVLAIAGVYATYSDWMAWELGTAYLNNIPVIGVAPWGQERVSTTVQNYASVVVRWNTESIVAAVRLYAK